MTRFFALIFPAFFSAAVVGSAAETVGVAAVNPPPHLTAVLTQPTEIKLEWQDPATGVAGHIVEYANEPDGDYVILGFCPPHQSTFVHPRLVPDTTFYYRVRALYGPASESVEISLPQELSDAAYAAAYAKPEDFHWAAPMIIPTPAHVNQQSIRPAGTRVGGAPSNLKITLERTTVSGFKLTWTDHASDEAGFLIEKLKPDLQDFSVCAVVDPNINSFGWIFEPPERKATFRVRAYYYGPPSNLESRKTGKSAL